MALGWRVLDHRDGPTARFRACGIDLHVSDCDGDGAWWEARRGREVLAEGEDIGLGDYFGRCQAAAEAALRAEIARRKAALRPPPPAAAPAPARTGAPPDRRRA